MQKNTDSQHEYIGEGSISTELLSQREQAAYEAGKAYWEPSEHHKEVWRKEGFAAGEAAMLDRVIAKIRSLGIVDAGADGYQFVRLTHGEIIDALTSMRTKKKTAPKGC